MTTVAASRRKTPRTSSRSRTGCDQDVTPEAIRARAYEIYMSRRGSGVPGDPLSDWLQAECEIRALARGEALLAGEQD